MPTPLLAAVEAELAKPWTCYEECVDIDPGAGQQTLRLATVAIPASVSFNGQAYQANIARIGTLHKAPGPEQRTAQMAVADIEGDLHQAVEGGLVLEGSRLTVHRLWPDLAPPNNVIQDYWHGRVDGYAQRGRQFTLQVTSGFPELSRRAWRRHEATCHNAFADPPG